MAPQVNTSNGRTAQALVAHLNPTPSLVPVSADKELEIPAELYIQSDLIDLLMSKLASLTTRLGPITINGTAPDTNPPCESRSTDLGCRLYLHNDRLRDVCHQLNYQLDNLAI